MIQILYFAALRERMAKSAETIPAPDPATVAGLVAHLRGRDPAGAAAFAHPAHIRAAVNQQFAKPETPIRDGDEVAFFPPVTGG